MGSETTGLQFSGSAGHDEYFRQLRRRYREYRNLAEELPVLEQLPASNEDRRAWVQLQLWSEEE